MTVWLSEKVLPRELRGAPVEVIGRKGEHGVKVRLLETRGIWPEGLELLMRESTVVAEPGEDA